MIAIVLAAGASTRMKTTVSKLLQPIAGKPLIALTLKQLESVCSEAIFVLGHQKDEIEKVVRAHAPASLKVSFVVQKEQRGTADAVRTALPCLGQGRVFILNGDCILLSPQSLQQWSNQHRQVLSVLTFMKDDPAAYGRIVRDSSGMIERIVEFKDASPEERLIKELNSGFYLVDADFLKSSLSEVTTNNQSKEFYLTDLVKIARSKKLDVSTVLIPEQEALGVNTLEEFVDLDRIIQRRIQSQWMARGVRFLNPLTTHVDLDVELAPDVVVGPGVQLLGKSVIGQGSIIGAYSVVIDSHVDPDVVLEAFSHLKEARIGSKSTIGPFARLRPGSNLDEEVHIGNFVEVKKSHLHKGVKAGHLSYLGDADIGESTNIGAGTITCNYDGTNKYKTEIGAHVFIGSNTSLVAPVKLGDGALVGAGSVISENVADNELSFERSVQIHKKDGAVKFRSKKKDD